MWRPMARAAWAWSALLVGASVAAQTDAPETNRVLPLAAALARTMAASPDLLAFGYQIEAAEGRLRQAALRPNPELGIAVQDVLGTDSFSGWRSAETTITLGWVLERGVRERIVDAARAGVSLSAADVDIARLDAAAETARRFLDCLAFQRRLENAGAAVLLAGEIVRLVAERVGAGRSLEAEQVRAEADLARAELLQEDYEHELLSAYHRLSAQWGDTQPDFAAVSGDVQSLPALESFDALLARIDANPELARFLSRQRLDEADLRLAEARSKPAWQVSTGLRRIESTNDVAIVAGIDIPLPIRDRNQGRIAEARAQLAQTQAETAASRVAIETALFVFYQELKHNLQLASRLTVEVIPKLARALVETRRAYALGRYGYSEWRIVQAELLDANSTLLEASINVHRVVIEIERLTGVRATLPPAAP